MLELHFSTDLHETLGERSLTHTQYFEQINALIKQSRSDGEHFAETLRQKRIPHLSFSQITTVESCEYRYYLQYIALSDLDPVPEYFTKGKSLHHIIAKTYEDLSRGNVIDIEIHRDQIDQTHSAEAKLHLRNAVDLHLRNIWQNKVVAIEQPFAMIIDNSMPVCVGVIDLVLQDDDGYIVVDHKTGRDFAPQDELQTAIYVAFIERNIGNGKCSFYYDQYRWVNNLSRIRKPAFQRIPITLQKNYWHNAVQRITCGWDKINKISTSGYAAKNGECFRCPYRSLCKPFYRR